MTSAGLIGCSSGSGGGQDPVQNVPPTAEVSSPAAFFSVEPGEQVSIEFVTDDPDDEATIDVVATPSPIQVGAVAPGDVLIAQGLMDSNGLPVSLDWDTTAVPDGTYDIEVRVSDELESTVAVAPGNVQVETAIDPGGRPVTVDPIDGNVRTMRVVAFPDGSLAVAGLFEGTLRLQPSEANAPTVSSLPGREELFLARFTPDGDLDWVQTTRVNSSSESTGFEPDYFDLTPMTNNRVALAAGYLNAFTAFEGTTSEISFPSLPFTPQSMVTVVSESGEREWSRLVGGGLGSKVRAVDGGSDGSLVVVGRFANFVQVQTGGTPLTIVGAFEHSSFALRYSSNGTPEWLRNVERNARGEGLDVENLGQRGYAVLGTYRGGAVFGEGVNAVSSSSHVSIRNAYLAVYENAGPLSNVVIAEGIVGVQPFDVEEADGELIAAIGVSGSALIMVPGLLVHPFVSTSPRTYLVRTNDSGDLLSCHASARGYVAERPTNLLMTRSSGEFVLAGNLSESTILGEGEAFEIELTPLGDQDLMLAAHATDGDLQFAIRDGGGGSVNVTSAVFDSPVTVLTVEATGTVTLGAETDNPQSFSDGFAFVRYQPVSQ